MIPIIISMIITIAGCLGLLICVMGMLGACITCKIDCELIEAIGCYKMKCICDKEWWNFDRIDYDDIYEFDMLRDCCPWLWRHKKRLPPEKYEIIKPFLSKKK